MCYTACMRNGSPSRPGIPQIASPALGPDERRNALWAEAISGLLLLPGAGWLLAGNRLRGLSLMVFSLLGTLPLVVQLAGLSAGLGLCCCLPPLYTGVAFDLWALNKWLDNPKPYTWRHLALEITISVVALLALIVLDLLLLLYAWKLIQEVRL